MVKLLWKSLSIEKMHNYIYQLLKLEPSQLVGLEIRELAILFQLIFELRQRTTIAVSIRRDYFDLDLFNGEYREYLRFFLRDPVASVYTLTSELKDRKFKDFRRLYLFTFRAFGKGDRDAQNKSPLLLVLKERDLVIQTVREAQKILKQMSVDKTLDNLTSKYHGKPRSFWARIRQKFLKLFN